MLAIDEQLAHKTSEAGNYCPFGCKAEDHVLVAEGTGAVSQVIYCCHLVGFTNDRKVMEGIEPVMVPVYDEESRKTDQKRWNGRFRVSGKKQQYVKRTDIMVNPTYLQIDTQNGHHMTETWGSARVYRNCTEAEADAWKAQFAGVMDDLGEPPIDDPETPEEKRERLQAELAALDAQETVEPEQDAPFGDDEPKTKKKKRTAVGDGDGG